MYQLTILLNNTAANFALSYKTKDAALATESFITQKIIDGSKDAFKLSDDFGYIATLRTADIAYCLFVDVEKSELCRFEQDITKRRAEQKMIELLNTDPETKKLFPMAPQQTQQPKKSAIIQ